MLTAFKVVHIKMAQSLFLPVNSNTTDLEMPWSSQPDSRHQPAMSLTLAEILTNLLAWSNFAADIATEPHLLPLTSFFSFFTIFEVRARFAGGRNEMPHHFTALLSAPTPPTHTWDGHFILEWSKWKGDLNLPCFLLPFLPTPNLSISHTQRLTSLMDNSLVVAWACH